jgi:hypothetical protein
MITKITDFAFRANHGWLFGAVTSTPFFIWILESSAMPG